MAESRRIKACAECRQQKLRCDMPRDRSAACSRCLKSGVECVTPDSFQWKSRRSKAEMQREIELLRRQVEVSQAVEPEIQHSPLAAMSTGAESSNQAAFMEYINPEHPQVSHPATSHRSGSVTMAPPIRQTRERALDDFILEPRKIDDCIDLYFQHYHQDLPILDPTFTPDQYYDYSPLLFWAMIVTGSRRYSEDPTLVLSIGPKARNMALQSLINIPQYIQLIQAVLLLCNWPPPIETIFKDPSLVFCGVAMQLALQHGLHMADTRQGFELDQLRSEKDHEAARIKPMRGNDGKLWTYCKIVCQSISICYGIDPYTPLDGHRFGSPIVPASSSRETGAKLHDLWITAMRTLTRHALLDDQTSPSPFSSLIGVFDSQICGIATQGNTTLELLKIAMARLHIGCFHFFDQTEARRADKILEVYQLSCSFVDAVATEDSANGFLLYSSQIVYRAIVLSAFVILRVLRSTLRELVDLLAGERRFLSTINMLKKRSLTNNDLDARNATILGILWQSRTAFRQADGSYDGLRMRNQARGSFSIAFDCYCYWIRELHGDLSFANMTNTATATTIGPHSENPDSMRSALRGSAVPTSVYGTHVLYENEAELAALFGLNDNFDAWTSMVDFGNLQ